MVEASPEPFRVASRQRAWRPLALVSMGLLACAVLLAAVHYSSESSPVELDRRETEIEKLQQEKKLLESQLSNQRRPLIHPETIKAAVHKATKAQVPAPHAKKAHMVDLVSERKALEQQLAAEARDSAGDPLVEGVLGSFRTKSGDGLLGHLKDTTDNVMGSLAATMTSAEKLKMLTNEAKAMGDVSPKEALAQRVISIGKHILNHPSPHHPSLALHPLPHEAASHKATISRSSAQQHAIKSEAAARLSSKHSALHTQRHPHGGGMARQGSAGVSAESVAAARRRVGLLKHELEQAKRVQRLEESLAHAKQSLHSTETKMSSVAKGQQLVAKLHGGEGKFAQAKKSARKFLGLNAHEGEEEEEEEGERGGHEEEEEKEKKAEDCRFRGDCHAKGYVSGGIVVGTAEHTGPDRYGQLGAGPQELKGKVGDNVVGAGLLGATGVYEDDVLVPTRLSGVRSRDTFKRSDNPRELKNLDDETRRELIDGSVMHHYGERRKLGIADERVPIAGMSAEEYKDRARTQQLAGR